MKQQQQQQIKQINNDIEEGYCSVETKTLLHKNGFRFFERSRVKSHTRLSVKMSLFNSGEEFTATIPHALAIEWIRHNFGIHFCFNIYGRKNNKADKYCVGIWIDGEEYESERIVKNLPQEATEAALLYTLKNLM